MPIDLSQVDPVAGFRCSVCHQDRPGAGALSLLPSLPIPEEPGPMACSVCVGNGRHMRSPALLRAAWPDGFLPMDGVQTIEGFQFVAHDVVFSTYGSFRHQVPERSYRILHHPSERHQDLQDMIDKGALLPVVDPSLTATWACLKRDLAKAVSDALSDSADLTWRPVGGKWWGEQWQLSNDSGLAVRFSGLDTTDPAFALVLAKIQALLDPTLPALVLL